MLLKTIPRGKSYTHISISCGPVFSRAHTLLAFYLFHFKMKLLNLGPGLFPTLNWQLKELYQGLFLVSHNQHCGGENQKKGDVGAQWQLSLGAARNGPRCPRRGPRCRQRATPSEPEPSPELWAVHKYNVIFYITVLYLTICCLL